jgi:hypothetical protein
VIFIGRTTARTRSPSLNDLLFNLLSKAQVILAGWHGGCQQLRRLGVGSPVAREPGVNGECALQGRDGGDSPGKAANGEGGGGGGCTVSVVGVAPVVTSGV